MMLGTGWILLKIGTNGGFLQQKVIKLYIGLFIYRPIYMPIFLTTKYKILVFFNWLFIVAWLRGLIATVIVFLFWEWYFIDIFETQQSQMRFVIYRAMSNVVPGPRPRCEQPWAQATPSNMRDLCRAVSNVVTGPLPTISIMRPGNPIYELL